jgi:DNA-binding FadR family transcriptional regulator
MLVARHGSGTFIAPVDLDHVFAVRLQLEPLAAACAAKSRTSRDADLLEQLVHDLRAALDDSPRFAEIDTQIHDTVSSASGNPVLRDVLERLNGLAKLSRELTAVDREVRGQTLVDLGQLATAIRRKDSELAGESMRAHIDHVFAALPGRST